MRNLVKMFAVVVTVLALSVGQSVLMAAPTHGAEMAVAHSANDSMYAHFLSVLGAIWGGGGGGAIWGGQGGGGAIWGGGGGAIWGGGGGGAIWSGGDGNATDGAIWGGGGGH